jgi:hypothetical protein
MSGLKKVPCFTRAAIRLSVARGRRIASLQNHEPGNS